MPDNLITLTTSAGAYLNRTDNNSIAIFDKIPCNEKITIAIHPPKGNEYMDITYYKRFIKCDKPMVDLGFLPFNKDE